MVFCKFTWQLNTQAFSSIYFFIFHFLENVCNGVFGQNFAKQKTESFSLRQIIFTKIGAKNFFMHENNKMQRNYRNCNFFPWFIFIISINIILCCFKINLTLFYNEFWSGTGVVFRTVFRQKYHNKMKEILKVEETNSESQIVIQAAK